MPQYNLERNQILTWSLPNSVTWKKRLKSLFYLEDTLYIGIFGSIDLLKSKEMNIKVAQKLSKTT